MLIFNHIFMTRVDSDTYKVYVAYSDNSQGFWEYEEPRTYSSKQRRVSAYTRYWDTRAGNREDLRAIRLVLKC